MTTNDLLNSLDREVLLAEREVRALREEVECLLAALIDSYGGELVAYDKYRVTAPRRKIIQRRDDENCCTRYATAWKAEH